jgi:hypothetical protein
MRKKLEDREDTFQLPRKFNKIKRSCVDLVPSVPTALIQTTGDEECLSPPNAR